MSTFDNPKAPDTFGSTADSPVAVTTKVVDCQGSLAQQPAFDLTLQVDRWGTLRGEALTGVGYLNLNGELTTHTTVWAVTEQSLAVPSAAVIAGRDVQLGAIAGVNIIATGALVTAGDFIVAGPASDINTLTTTQQGGGTVTLYDPQTVGTVSVTDFIVEPGATLKLGTDWSKQHGWFYGAGTAQLNNKGTVEIRPADILATDPLSTEPQVGGNTTGVTAATLRFIGNLASGTTYIRDRAPITAGGVVGATVELSGRIYLGVNGFSGTGTVKVVGGSALSSSDMPSATVLAGSWSATVSYEIAGEGVSRAGLPAGALIVRNAQVIEGAKLTLMSNARVSGDVEAAGALKTPIFSAAGQTLLVGSPAVGGRFGDAATAVVRLTSANPNMLGAVKVEHGTLQLGIANSAVNASQIELTGNAILLNAVGNNIRSIKATNSTTTVQLSANLTLSAQDPTPVKCNLAGTGGVIIAGGTLMVDRATVSTSGTINVTTGKFGTTQAVLTTTGIFSPGATGGGTLVLTNVGGVPSKIVAPTINAPTSGWKVDIPAGLSAGTYTILTRTNGSVVVPVVGVNASGLTPTFAWAGGNLNMTLA
jgi:hypothetical protein